MSVTSRRRARAGRAFSSERVLERVQALVPGAQPLRLCVAFSGGLDSTALLSALAQAQARTKALALRAAHVDHGLQPDSPGWARHCRRLARRLGVPLKVLRVSVTQRPGESLEESARTARYAALARVLEPEDVLLTAHNQDDQLETVLLQLFRGCGLAGLAAMPAVSAFGRSMLVRPLLGFTRAQLATWVEAQDLPVLHDPSNADERFDRNYLRHQILPAVRERWSGVAAAVTRTARHAAEGQQLLAALARADVEHASDGAALSAKALRALSLPRRRNALRWWIASHGRTLPDARRLEQIAAAVIEARADSHPEVTWGTARVERHADLLSIVDTAVSDRVAPREEVHWDVSASRRCVLPAECGVLELRTEAHGPLDLDALGAALTVRWRRGGERLRLRPGAPRRALKSLLQEGRVPPPERSRVPLVFRDDVLIAAGDLWLEESVRARRTSRRRARLIWKKAPHVGC